MATLQDCFKFLDKINEANALVGLDQVSLVGKIYLTSTIDIMTDHTEKRSLICNNEEDFKRLIELVEDMSIRGFDLKLVKNIIKADLDEFDFTWEKVPNDNGISIYGHATKRYEAPKMNVLFMLELLY